MCTDAADVLAAASSKANQWQLLDHLTRSRLVQTRHVNVARRSGASLRRCYTHVHLMSIAFSKQHTTIPFCEDLFHDVGYCNELVTVCLNFLLAKALLHAISVSKFACFGGCLSCCSWHAFALPQIASSMHQTAFQIIMSDLCTASPSCRWLHADVWPASGLDHT
jgi:hypothetical protein